MESRKPTERPNHKPENNTSRRKFIEGLLGAGAAMAVPKIAFGKGP
jgi:hypothetical protein